MGLTYRIDCRELTSRAAAHDCFARVFSLPAFYGRNLDALWDCICALREPVTIEIVHVDALKAALGDYAGSFLETLDDLTRARDGFEVRLNP